MRALAVREDRSDFAPVRVVAPLPLLRDVLLRLAREARPVDCPAGRVRTPEGEDWLLQPPRETHDRPEAELSLVIGRHGIRAGAGPGQPAPAGHRSPSRMAVVGPGMHALPLGKERLNPVVPLRDVERWSRAIGGLGGQAVWQRLTTLRAAIIGCGRTGSLMAMALGAVGLRGLVLIDADRVETHNLGEMDGATDADLGRPKVFAVADALERRYEHLRGAVLPVAAGIDGSEARLAAAGCDLLVMTVDRDSARLAAALIATACHRVLLDVGTGIFRTGGGRRMGADLRLILPGDGCLLCAGGGLADLHRAQRDIGRAPGEVPPVPWNVERAGSSRFLNQLASGTAGLLLEELIRGELERSVWSRMEYEPDRGLDATRLELPADPACPVCRVAGRGESAFTGTDWSATVSFHAGS